MSNDKAFMISMAIVIITVVAITSQCTNKQDRYKCIEKGVHPELCQ